MHLQPEPPTTKRVEVRGPSSEIDSLEEVGRGATRSPAFFERFVPIVRNLARGLVQRMPTQSSGDDLVGAGLVALAELRVKLAHLSEDALERIAVPRVRWAMLDELRNADPLSRRMRRRARAIARGTRQLELELGRSPTQSEVASRLGLKLDVLGRALRLARASDGASTESVDAIDVADDAMTPEENAGLSEEVERLERAMATLPERQRRIVQLYFREELTLRQIGVLLGITEARVSQIVAEAVGRLRTVCVGAPRAGGRTAPGRARSDGHGFEVGRSGSAPNSLAKVARRPRSAA